MGMSKSLAEICAKDQVETVLTAGRFSNRPPNPSSNDADKLAAEVVTRGFSWYVKVQPLTGPRMAKTRRLARREDVIE
jgi:hypothetical protein